MFQSIQCSSYSLKIAIFFHVKHYYEPKGILKKSG